MFAKMVHAHHDFFYISSCQHLGFVSVIGNKCCLVLFELINDENKENQQIECDMLQNNHETFIKLTLNERIQKVKHHTLKFGLGKSLSVVRPSQTFYNVFCIRFFDNNA